MTRLPYQGMIQVAVTPSGVIIPAETANPRESVLFTWTPSGYVADADHFLMRDDMSTESVLDFTERNVLMSNAGWAP